MANYMTQEAKEAVRRLYMAGLTNPEIARVIGVHTETVKYRLRSMGLEPRPGKRGRGNEYSTPPEFCERCPYPDCVWTINRPCMIQIFTEEKNDKENNSGVSVGDHDGDCDLCSDNEHNGTGK